MSLERIVSGLTFDRARNHLHWLIRHAPRRISGSPDDERAAGYFADGLERAGLETHVDTFMAYRSTPIRSTLRIVSPRTEELPSLPCGHIASTPDEGMELDLVDGGDGAADRYTGLDVRNRAVLVDISSDPPRPEAARLAARHGAAAIVFANRGLPEFEAIPNGAIKCVWGNPTRQTIGDIPQIAALSISRSSGDRLRALLGRVRVRVHVIAQATREWSPLNQVWGRLRASHNPGGDLLLVGGHYDAWEPGATDNGAGNAALLELATAFALHRDALRRDLIFAFWNGHEIGDCEGSTAFLDRHWDELDRHAVAYVNVDSVGLAQTAFYRAASTPELERFHLEVEHKVLGTPCEHRRLTRDHEHPFFPLGLPALEGRFHFGEEQIAAWGGARGSWWWHSEADTLDKVDPSRWEQTARVYAGYLWGLGTLRVLPMRFGPMVSRLDEAVRTVEQTAGDRFVLGLPVAELRHAVDQLDPYLDRLRSSSDERRIRPANRVVKRLSRLLLPAFETAGGRYAQDRCALAALSAPIPALADLEALMASPPDSEAAALLYTELLRARNRLSDALRGAIEAVDGLLEPATG